MPEGDTVFRTADKLQRTARWLGDLDEEYGVTVGWLAETGWTEAQVEALRRRLTA